jgi:hypothetical protein
MLVSGGRRSADLQSALGEQPSVRNALEPDPPKLSTAREKPVTDPAVAKGFGGQGGRSARRLPLRFSLFTLHRGYNCRKNALSGLKTGLSQGQYPAPGKPF